MEVRELGEIRSVEQVPERPDYEEELKTIIKSKASDLEIKEKLAEYHENDIAEALEDLTLAERKKLYCLLGNDRISEVFAYVEKVGDYIAELDLEKAADIIESMDADDAVDVLGELDQDKSDEILELMNDEAQSDIKLIHSYEEDEIGSRMTTNFIVIRRGTSVKEAMKELVDQAAENDNISTLYVVDEDETFYGAIDLKDLIIARQHTEIEELVTTSYPYVYAKESIAACIEELKDYSEDSIPVLANNHQILGVITAQDIVEVVDEEMGEDYAKLAGLTAEEDLKEPLLQSMKKRIPWLVILLFLGIGVSTVISLFEGIMSQLTLLVCFQSLILDMAGNTGTQSLAVTIRVLMDENLSGKQKLFLIGKEMRVGFLNGIVLGSLAFLGVGLYIWRIKAETPTFSFAISACIGLALLLAIIISSFTGTVIPIAFHKMKVDPAVASGPLITTVNDLVAVVMYYGLTWVLLIHCLQLTG